MEDFGVVEEEEVAELFGALVVEVLDGLLNHLLLTIFLLFFLQFELDVNILLQVVMVKVIVLLVHFLIIEKKYYFENIEMRNE